MRSPIQASPMSRNFMQKIVGRHWSPDAGSKAAPPETGRRKAGKGKQTPPNPCLVQLTTFAVARRGV